MSSLIYLLPSSDRTIITHRSYRHNRPVKKDVWPSRRATQTYYKKAVETSVRVPLLAHIFQPSVQVSSSTYYEVVSTHIFILSVRKKHFSRKNSRLLAQP